MLKFYVVVRDDLSVAQQAVQSAHAVADFAREHPDEFLDWNTDNNTIVLLRTHRDALGGLLSTLEDGDFVYTVFEDDVFIPHLEGRRTVNTAVAIAPNWYTQNIVLKDYKLALDPSNLSWEEWWQKNGDATMCVFWLLLAMAAIVWMMAG